MHLLRPSIPCLSLGIRSLGAGWLLAALLAPALLAQLPERVPLPPGYEWPQTPSVHIPDPLFDPPSRGCASCAADGDLRLYYRDFAGFRRNLDRYAGRRVTWELLTFEHGFKAVWLGPHVAIRLYQHGADQVRVVTRERLVVFEKTAAEDGTVALKCVSDDDWALARHDDRIRVTSPDRWFDFETPDFGATWRLVETAPRGTPLVVKLHYGGPGPLPTSLEYPDGKLAVIEPSKTNADAVGLIRLPNGIEFRIEYDPTTFPRLLEEWFPNPEPVKQEIVGFQMVVKDGKTVKETRYRDIPQPKLICIRRWAWENDHLGRIRHQVAPCDRELTLDYAESTSKETGKETLMILTDPSDGSYTYLRHQEQASTWTIERGHGTKDQSIEQATMDKRTVQRSIRNEMKLVKLQTGANPRTVTFDYSPTGEQKSRSVHDAAGNLIETVPVDPAVAARFAPWRRSDDGEVAEAAFPGFAVTYLYNDDQLPRAILTGDREEVLVIDRLGRLRSREIAGRLRETWTYTQTGLLDTYTRYAPDPAQPGGILTVRETLVYRYDPLDRVVARQPAPNPPDRFAYVCEGMQRAEIAGESVRVFHYRGGRVWRIVEGQLASGDQQPVAIRDDRYEYTTKGLLGAMQRRLPDTLPQVLRFRYDDFGLRHIDRTEGPVPAQDLNRSVRSIGIGGYFGQTQARLNSFGAVIEPAPKSGLDIANRATTQ